jgi:outer membrane protein TolC
MYNVIGTSPMSDGMRTSGDDAWGIMFGITIPIWDGKNDARVDQAESQLVSAIANLEDQGNQAYADIERIYWQLQNQGRLVELYRETLLPEAMTAVELSQTWYEGDQIPFTNLVETTMIMQNFQLATIRAETDYLKSLAELQKLTGIPVFESGQEVEQ